MIRSTWIDLAAATERSEEVHADVCVIGAGAAGIYLTLELAQQGRNVVLLEAGPASCTDVSGIGFEALFEADPYPGATAGRFFGIGGSTSRWGGLLVPHTAHDLREGGASTRAWSHIVHTVTEHAPRVLQQLGYQNGPDFEDCATRLLGQAGRDLSASGIDTQAALALPFRFKNFAGLLKRVESATAPPRVFFNAVVKRWTVVAGQRDASRVAQVHAASSNHNVLSVSAGIFVIAAGTIESARILLEINGSASQPVLPQTAAIGCYLADHLSVPIADVSFESLDQVVNLFAPRFSGSWMRSFRFLEGNPSQNTPRAFAHFIFSNSGVGFELAKEMLGAVQRRRMPSIAPASFIAGLGDLGRLAYGRFVNSVLYIPSGAPVHLQLDVEQTAVRQNHVSLTDLTDAYGRRVASIYWQVTNNDTIEIAEMAQRFLAKWPGTKAGLPQLQPRSIGSDGTKPYDAYHPVGTCRMGDDIESVVDTNLKVRNVQNLWLSSTGVLPSAGTANPTFTMLCLTHQLAEHLRTAYFER